MTAMTESDMKAMRDRIDALARDFYTSTCEACKQRMTKEDTDKIKVVSAELKTLSGHVFEEGRRIAGYRFKDMARTLDSILFGRT